MEDAGEFALGVVMTAVAGLGGDGEEEVVEESFAVGFASVIGIQEGEEMGELAHFEMGVGAELLVLLVLAEFVPPFVGAAFVAGGVELGCVIEVVDFFTFEVVVAFEADALAGREEGEGAEAGAVGLDGEGVELGHEPPFAGEFFDGDIDALATGVGFSAMGKFGGSWLVGGVFVDLELEGALLVFADAVEVIFEATLGGFAQGGVFSGEVFVLFENGVEDAFLEAGVGGVDPFDAAKDAGEEVEGTLLHGGGDGAVGVVGMDVAGDAAASEKSAGHESGDGASGLAVGVVGVAENLVDGGATGFGFAIGFGGGEGGGGAIEVGVDAVFIGADVVDPAHDEELIGEGLEGGHGASEALGLEGRGDTEAEEEVEGADGDFGGLD